MKQLFNKTQNQIVITQLKIADTFITRMIGLMFKIITPHEGLLIDPCNSIHCFFMKMPIDVLFIDKNNKVIHKITKMKPWRISPIISKSKYVIEGYPHRFDNININDKIEIQ